jgi:hypothetical protein
MEALLPLLGFAIATSATPGPNTLMVAASAANHGLRAVVPHVLGIAFGFAAMIWLAGLGPTGYGQPAFSRPASDRPASSRPANLRPAGLRPASLRPASL